MGQGTAAMYLLIHAPETRAGIEADVGAELSVQLGMVLPNAGLLDTDAGPIRVLWIDRWIPELVSLLDTHVVRLERTGAQFLFLTTATLAERLLVEAPNFRNRLTEVLQIVEDDPAGDAHR